jgi:hypothetical protein
MAIIEDRYVNIEIQTNQVCVLEKLLLRGWLLDPGGREGLREVKTTFY